MAAMFIISTSSFTNVLLLLLLALASTSQCSSSSSSSSSSKDIFILAGQSNMAGRGGVKDGKFREDNIPKQSKPNPSIIRLTSNLKWEEAHEPLHSDIDVGKTCGVGPGMAFANEILRLKRIQGRRKNGTSFLVGLVPCAKGGSKIDEWRKGSVLYDELVRRASESVKGGDDDDDDGKIKALLWYQGESDTVREEDAEGYKVKMENFVRDIRLDLHLPSLLVIQVALASGEGKFIEKVREAQLGIRLPNVKCVDAKGLSLKADKLHLTAISEAHLGIRLAHAYIEASSTTTASYYQFNHTQSYIAS